MKVDAELQVLLHLLSIIQEAVGGKVDKKMKEKGKGDRFMDLKQAMIGRIVEVKKLLASTKSKTPGQELQPKEVIATNAQIREHMRQLHDEFKDLDRLFQKEQAKKKSKLTPDELKVRGEMVTQIMTEIQNLKDMSLAGYVKGYNTNRGGLIVNLEESEAFKGPLGALPMQTDMTEDHRAQLQQIQQRDKELDARYLDQIEKGVEDLRDIALRANEAVKTTNVMLDNLEQKIIDVQDHLDNVNRKMKNTLDQVGRRSDKMCIDVICIVLLLAMIGVSYNLLKKSGIF